MRTFFLLVLSARRAENHGFDSSRGKRLAMSLPLLRVSFLLTNPDPARLKPASCST
jgi:hypothetical protein